jgi:hypothetical protein
VSIKNIPVTQHQRILDCLAAAVGYHAVSALSAEIMLLKISHMNLQFERFASDFGVEKVFDIHFKISYFQ